MTNLKNKIEDNIYDKNTKEMLDIIDNQLCCEALYEGFNLGYYTIRGTHIVLNKFIEIRENIPKINFSDYKDNSIFKSPIINNCPYCLKESLNVSGISVNNLTDNNKEGYTRKTFNFEERMNYAKDYTFCCKNIEILVKIGFITVFPVPNSDYKEILINNFIIPKKAFNFLTNEEYNPNDFLSSYPFEICPFCKTQLVQYLSKEF